MYVFGGSISRPTTTLDIQCYSFQKNEWKEIKSNGAPINRRNFSAVVKGKELYLFGGRTNEQTPKYLNDFYVFSFETKDWKKLESENTPSERSGCSLSFINNTLFLFGGMNVVNSEPNYYNNVYSYNFETKTWTNFETKGEVPSPRERHSSVSINNKLFVNGGWVLYGEMSQDLFELNIETNEWKKYENKEKGTFGSSMELIDNNLIVIGGRNNEFELTENYYSFEVKEKIENKVQNESIITEDKNDEVTESTESKNEQIIEEKVDYLSSKLSNKEKQILDVQTKTTQKNKKPATKKKLNVKKTSNS
jgi:N-acetylneuraminic acid mutarotase